MAIRIMKMRITEKDYKERCEMLLNALNAARLKGAGRERQLEIIDMHLRWMAETGMEVQRAVLSYIYCGI